MGGIECKQLGTWQMNTFYRKCCLIQSTVAKHKLIDWHMTLRARKRNSDDGSVTKETIAGKEDNTSMLA